MNDILDDFPIVNKKNRSFYLASICYYLILLAMLVCTPITFYEIESVLISGPLIFFLGLLLLVFNRRKKNKYTFIGLSSMLFSLSVFLYIFILEISPKGAESFLPHLSVVYDFIVLIYIVTIKD